MIAESDRRRTEAQVAPQLLTKGDEEPGSAVRAAGALHGSAHVHAIRYGEKGSKSYRRAYSQHVGRFLSCLREVSKSGSADEPRDQSGRWSSGSGSAKPYGTTGTVGLNRGQIVGKVRGFLDAASSHTDDLPRAASYAGTVAAKVAGAAAGMAGAPPDVQDQLTAHVAHATGYVARKVLGHPGLKALATKVLTRMRKSLESADQNELKGIVANVVADTSLHPRVSCDDAALAQVARGAYRHCHDRLHALKQAATS